MRKTFLQRALEIEPDFAEAYYQLGCVYRERGQIEKAIESFKRSIALRPNLAPACNTLAWYYVEQEQHLNDAITFAKRAVESDPIAPYWDTLAIALYKNRRYIEASEAIGKALELQPTHPEYVAHQKLIRNGIIEQNR